MTQTAPAARPARVPREEDPRNPNFRLAALLDPGTMALISDNPAYQRETVTRSMARDVLVLGRMVWPRGR